MILSRKPIPFPITNGISIVLPMRILGRMHHIKTNILMGESYSEQMSTNFKMDFNGGYH